MDETDSEIKIHRLRDHQQVFLFSAMTLQTSRYCNATMTPQQPTEDLNLGQPYSSQLTLSANHTNSVVIVQERRYSEINKRE